MVSMVSLDSGYAVMKGVQWDGEELRNINFQAIAERCQEKHYKEIKHGLKVNGQYYALQESGRLIDSTKIIEPDKKVFHGSEGQHAQKCWALECLKIENGHHPRLITALPYSDSKDEQLIESIKSNKVFEWENKNGEKRKVSFEEVVVYPQGVGALRLFQAVTGIEPKKVSLIDIGSITLDIVSLRRFRNEPHSYNVGASGSVREGAGGYSLFSDLNRRMKDVSGLTEITESYHDISDRVETKDFNITAPGGVIKNVESLYDDSRKEFTLNTLVKSKKIVGNEWENTDAFILTGGIASCLDIGQWECKGRTYITDNWANSLGQLHANLNEEHQKKLKEKLVALANIKFLNANGDLEEVKILK